MAESDAGQEQVDLVQNTEDITNLNDGQEQEDLDENTDEITNMNEPANCSACNIPIKADKDGQMHCANCFLEPTLNEIDTPTNRVHSHDDSQWRISSLDKIPIYSQLPDQPSNPPIIYFTRIQRMGVEFFTKFGKLLENHELPIDTHAKLDRWFAHWMMDRQGPKYPKDGVSCLIFEWLANPPWICLRCAELKRPDCAKLSPYLFTISVIYKTYACQACVDEKIPCVRFRNNKVLMVLPKKHGPNREADYME